MPMQRRRCSNYVRFWEQALYSTFTHTTFRTRPFIPQLTETGVPGSRRLVRFFLLPLQRCSLLSVRCVYEWWRKQTSCLNQQFVCAYDVQTLAALFIAALAGVAAALEHICQLWGIATCEAVMVGDSAKVFLLRFPTPLPCHLIISRWPVLVLFKVLFHIHNILLRILF